MIIEPKHSILNLPIKILIISFKIKIKIKGQLSHESTLVKMKFKIDMKEKNSICDGISCNVEFTFCFHTMKT